MGIISERLKKIRTENGLTQKELAEKIGVALSVIGDIESNRRPPSKKTALKLSQFFNTPLEMWIDESDITEYRNKRGKYAMLDEVISKLIKSNMIINGEPTQEAWELIKKALSIDLKFINLNQKEGD
ncbi:MAG: helix-turn-helix domain-containing protein [Caloramator sp.]|nr:helix-turn-helix domain-containing protein [Caloramator sp.]